VTGTRLDPGRFRNPPERMAMESLKKKKERTARIFEILDPLYTREKTALKYRSPFQLLISTILSAMRS